VYHCGRPCIAPLAHPYKGSQKQREEEKGMRGELLENQGDVGGHDGLAVGGENGLLPNKERGKGPKPLPLLFV
jgi:hypothetical protein